MRFREWALPYFYVTVPAAKPKDTKAESIRQKCYEIIKTYKKNLSQNNMTGERRASELEFSIRYRKDEELINVIADFINTGKTHSDRKFTGLFSIFRIGTSSDLERHSLRGMFIDNLLPKGYYAKAVDWQRICNIRTLTRSLDNVKQSLMKALGVKNISAISDPEEKKPLQNGIR